MLGKRTLAALLLLVVSSTCHAGRWGVGIYFGGPYYRPYYRPLVFAPPPIYYAPPLPVVVYPGPVVAVPVYKSQSQAQEAEGVPRPFATASIDPPPSAVRPVSAKTEQGGLSDPAPSKRAESAVAAGRAKDQRAVGALTKMLQDDPSALVREAAARGLGLIAVPGSLSALQTAALADDDREVRKSAAFAAEVIRGNLRR